MIRTLPTCVLDIVEEGEKRKRDVELLFTCYTLPVVTPASPVYRSPTHSFINTRVPHRRKDSYKKSEKSGEKKEKSAGSGSTMTSVSAHQFRANLDDTDDGVPTVYLSPKCFSRPAARSRECVSSTPGSTSSPNLLSRQNTISDPMSRKTLLDEMYQDIQWLIDDQHINHLRRKTPVSLDVLKQVLNSGFVDFQVVFLLKRAMNSNEVTTSSTSYQDFILNGKPGLKC